MAYVYRFRSPDFLPLGASADEIVSIGSGEGVTEYSDALRNLGDGFSYLQMEVMGPGGSGLGLLHSISHAVETTPTPGISRHLHVCIAMRGKILLANNDRQYIGESSGDIVMPPVAQSLPELARMLGERGHAVAFAAC